MPCLVVRREVRPRARIVLATEQLRRATHRHPLQRKPDREQLAQLLDLEPDDLRPVMRHVLRQTERLELTYRFPDRRDAHPLLLRDLLQAEVRARPDLPEDDRLAQPLERRLCHGAVPHRH